MENLTNTETQKQGFPLPPPPSKPRKRKAPEDCYLSFIDQIQDGFYHASKLVRSQPQTHKDIYFLVRTIKTSVGSFRREKTHRNVSLFRTKAGGPRRANIEFMTCSFLEIDGSTDGTIKSVEDVQALIKNNNLPTASYVIQTSIGHFHILWTYVRPLPWTNKGESYWTAQQKRLIQLFEKGGFNVDKGASLNPTQNLRNPSQLNAYNYKRRCKVEIHSSYRRTSLRAIYQALNATDIPNPRPIRTSVKLRRDLRQNKTFITTHKAYAKKHGVSERTIKREIKKAIQNGDLRIVARLGNNNGQVRTTQYESMLFIEQFPEVPLSICKDNSLKKTNLLTDFQADGTEKGYRNKTIFALGLYLKAQLGKQACEGALRDALKGGAMRCHVQEKEFEKTLQNIMKPIYNHPFSLAKMQDWGLLEVGKSKKDSLH